ncbi:MAG TPA: XkdF-like putative serine protease domain-containing protein, partial [Desulfosporosinus sp.]|nr:XkdF-like putative serine protease domain-containing protein [Desulfosporosinus sp.]
DEETFSKLSRHMVKFDGYDKIKSCLDQRRKRGILKAQWTTAFINTLPDSSFLHISAGGKKDAEGMTSPRTLRHLPYKDGNGKIDLPHLRNALARLDQTSITAAEKKKVRDKAEEALAQERDKQGLNKCEISFVSAEVSPLEEARDEILVGKAGQVFNDLYLNPLGLTRKDIHLTVLEFRNELDLVNPRVVVALGKTVANELGVLADFVLPHPVAVLKFGDSGEVKRKCTQIKKLLVDKVSVRKYFIYRFDELIEISSKTPTDVYDGKQVKIVKQDDFKRIVYGVVSDPYGQGGSMEDAHNDWIPPDEIEKMAHNFLKNSRVVGLKHSGTASAQVVESWIEQYPNHPEEYKKAMQGLRHKVSRRDFGDDKVHSGSWVMGVELGENEWEAYKSGDLNAFSIGGIGVREPLSKSQMPQVDFVDLVEKS